MLCPSKYILIVAIEYTSVYSENGKFFVAHVVDNGEVVIGNGGKAEVYLYGNGSDDEALRLSFHTLVSRWKAQLR